MSKSKHSADKSQVGSRHHNSKVRRRRRKRNTVPHVEVVAEATEHVSLYTVVVENMSRFQSAFYLTGTVSSLYLCVSLFSYSAADLSGGVGQVSNVGGMLGAYASAGLFYMFGYSAWFMLCVSGFFGLRLAGRQFLDAWRVFGVSGLIWVSCCIWALLHNIARAAGSCSCR